MKTVYKYTIGQIADSVTLSLPIGAQPLCVNLQRGIICLWAIVDTEEVQKEDVTVVCVGTGHPMDDHLDYKYLGTILVANDALVLHYFTVRKAVDR